LSEQKSLNFIIDQWAIHVWKQENPQNKDDRFDAYDRLFRTIISHGYKFDDIHESVKKQIKKHTVPTKGPKDKLEWWNKSANKHIEHAMANVFGPQVEIASSNGVKLPVFENKPLEVKEEIKEAIKSKKYKEYIPDEKNLEFIDKNFKFEGSDEDLG
jgi:hypothetical protein